MIKSVKIFCRARLDVNAYVMWMRSSIGLFLACFPPSLSLSLTFTHIKAVGVIFGCPPVMLIPLGQPIFTAFHVLNRTHVTKPDHTTIYFHLPWATYLYFPPDLHHLARIYFLCCFRLTRESRAALLVTKDWIDPRGNGGNEKRCR